MRLIDLRVDYDLRRQGLGAAMAYQIISASRDIGLRAVLYTQMKKDIPDRKTYDKGGYELVLPDSPTVLPENADQWIGRGWGDFEPTPDPCKS